MSAPDRRRDKRRNARRIPLECKIKIRVPETSDTYYGICRNLSVDGLLFVTDYVPRFGQMLEVHVLPGHGPGAPAPLNAVVEVRHCTRAAGGERYEIGAAIVHVKG